ncbi:VOC family protein [Kitasatospora sp. NPDC048722]|uniref:VOC family protein n=1 Tax=Kitasatospora sp. NPDC048722 TaxID=3155639 RepID=UPI0033E18D13
MTRWSHVGLNCRDQRRTEEYYTRWFGFRRARAVPVEGGEIVFLRNGDAHLELLPATGESVTPGRADGPGTPGTVRHIAFQTDDVDTVLTRMGPAAHVLLGPLDFDDLLPGWRAVWLRDPDGVVVELGQGYRDQDAHETPESDTTHA